METKLITTILGVALVLATAAVYTQSAFAVGNHDGNGNGVHGSGAGPCSNPIVVEHNPRLCLGSGPTSDSETPQPSTLH